MKRLSVQTIFAIIMLTGIFGCKNNKRKDFVFDEFKSRIENAGFRIDSVDNTGIIYIKHEELTLEINLDNLKKDYERDKDVKIISDFVNTLISYSVNIPSEWNDARKDIYISLFPNESILDDIVQTKLTDEISKVYLHCDSNKSSFITKTDLEDWNITEKQIIVTTQCLKREFN